jgi:hypothetical protein
MSFKAYVIHRSIIYAQLESLLRPPFFLFHKYSLAHTRQLARAKFVAANLRIVYHTERILWSVEHEKREQESYYTNRNEEDIFANTNCSSCSNID